MTISSKLAVGVISLALLAGFSFAQDEEIVAQYGAITIKKVMTVEQINGVDTDVETVVAFIDDSSDEEPVIPNDVVVDSVHYSRIFKQGVASTIMLPFEAQTWQLAMGMSLFEIVEIKKDWADAPQYSIYVRNSSYSKVIRANTPYVAISESGDLPVSFHKRHQTDGYVFNTTVNDKKSSYSMGGIDWTFQGTYERIEFTDPKGIYGFAAKNKNDVKMGDFKKAACSETSCAYIRPFRAYLKCSMASTEPQSRPALSKPAADGEIASLDDLPDSIAVYVVDGEEGGTTYLGRINTATGEFVNDDNRWFDMKGRMLNRKPTTKGTYYYNRKKVIIK